MTTEEKIETILRAEDNCRWVRDKLLEISLAEESEML